MTLRGRAALLLAPSRARLLAASCALAVSAVGFALFGPGSLSGQAAAQADAAAGALRAEQAGLRHRIRALATPPAAPVDADPTRFMQAVHEAAARSGVRVVRLAPRQGREEMAAMDLQLAAAYGNFLRFAAELELLGAALRLPQVAVPAGPPASGGGAHTLAITLVAELPRRGPSAGPHAEDVARAASDTALRDPFAPARQEVRDISAEYRLSGITAGGAGGAGASATINGMDYEPGESLDGMQVVGITDDAVHLARGQERFLIALPPLPQAAVPAPAAARTPRRR